MNKRLNTLLLTTALTLPLAAPVMAQSAEDACQELTAMLENGLPSEMEGTEAELQRVIDANDVDVCVVQLTEIRERMSETETAATGDAEIKDSETAVVADTERTTVTLQDEVAIEGRVYLESKPPSVDVASGDTEVEIEPGNPSVTVSEGQADILIRQAPATVTVNMPQPTIRIEQAAPEIIITMPDPNVDVANAQPRVEVRQAEPVVKVTQAPPAVELELQRAVEGSEAAGIRVNDRRTGTDYAAGENLEPLETQDAEVNVTTAEPIVRMIENPDARADVTINRSEPRVRFEQAEPKVEFASSGEPTIEFVQSGEPTVRFSADGETDRAATETNPNAAAGTQTETAMAETEEPAETDLTANVAAENAEAEVEAGAAELAQETEEAGTELEQTAENAEESVEAGVTELAQETEEAGNALEQTAESEVGNGYAIEREGYRALALNEIEFDTLEGMDVYGENDENLGEIGNLVLSSDGQVEAVIVEVGGFLGLGEKPVALPFDRFSFLREEAGDGIVVYVSATEEELESMERADY